MSMSLPPKTCTRKTNESKCRPIINLAQIIWNLEIYLIYI